MNEPFELTSTPIEPGTTLIEASAGTGKTYCISGMVLRALIEEPRHDISKILVVTFTKAAAEELADRIRKFVSQAYVVFAGFSDDGSTGVEPFIKALAETCSSEQRVELAGVLRDALLRFDEFTVGTIHSFCKQTLERSAFESGMPFQVDFVEDAEKMRLDVARDFWRRRIYGADPLLAALAVSRRWKPEYPFLADHGLWRRYPDTELVPGDEDLDRAVTELRAVCDAAKAAYDRESVEGYFGQVKLNKYKAGRTSADTLDDDLSAIEHLLFDGDASEFPALMLFTPEKVAEAIGKNSKLGKQQAEAAAEFPFFSACRATQDTADRVERTMRVAFVRAIDREFEAERRRTVTVTYDDLITLMHEALSDETRREQLRSSVAAQYSVAFIDEFQDTDLVQYEIFDGLFPQGPLFVIGDPKQAIYGFRGADIFAYLRARREAARSYTLGENWRSSRPMVESVNALFEGARRPFVFGEIPFEPAHAAAACAEPRLGGDGKKALEWVVLPAHSNKPGAGRHIERVVANEIVELLNGAVTLAGEPLAPRDIAILVRTNRQAANLQTELQRAGLTVVTGDSGDVFASEAARELERVLTAVVSPTASPAVVRAALATRLWGMTAGEIHGLNVDDSAWGDLLSELNEYHTTWLSDGFTPMMARLVTERQVRSNLLGTDGGTRALTNLMHIIEMVHQAAHDSALSPHGTLAWLAAERHHATAGSDDSNIDSDRRKLRLESDADAIRIVTMHSAKGLEYEIVFCPYLWESFQVKGRPSLLVHEGDEYERVVFAHEATEVANRELKSEAERVSDDLRLLYVALTRAKQRCYVFAGALGHDGAYSSGLRYLLDQPTDADMPDEKAPDVLEVGDWVEQVFERPVKDETWQRAVNALAGANEDKMGSSELEESLPARSRLRAKNVNSEQLSPRELVRGGQSSLTSQLVAWRATSFSSIQSQAHEDRAEAELPERRDPVSLPARTASQPEPAGIFAFAKGAAPGNCLHEIFEHADFRAACSESGLPDQATRELIAARLADYGFDRASAHEVPIDPAEVTAAMVGATCRHELPGAGFALRDTEPGARAAEWRFFTPLGGLSPSGLQEVFATYGQGRVCDDYAAGLARLDRREIEGYLNGIVDLLFEHDGRWFVIDWKSNHLGYRLADYGQDGMWRAMRGHDYVLQYHLYVLAVHRYLRSRLPGYDYEKHFGGAYYVFLRGMNDDGEEGWYRDRPPLALIEALDRAAGMREAA